MSKPILYKANETNFSHLGLGVLVDEMGTEVTEERNGQFYLEMTYPVDSISFKELKNDRIIKASASPKLPDQRFKIVRITKEGKGRVRVYAEHVSYHSADQQLKPNVSFSGNAESALNSWENNLVDAHPFTVYSDISTTGSGEWTITEVENARQALGGVRGSILDIYGGEYRFDNYHIMLLEQRGDDNGLPIMYGKNLTDLEQDEEIANTYTSIMPFATYIPEGGDEPITITLPEYFIDSDHVSKYARRKILRVDFSNEEIKTVSALRNRAKQYIKDNEVGVPRVNLRVKFVDLAKTLDYKDVAKAEEINLCDWVHVYFEKLDIATKAKVIKTIWNPVLDRYEELEIGNARASLSGSINNIVDGKVDDVENDLNRVQIAANGKTKLFRGATEPTTGISKNDLWYKPVGDGEIELYTYTGEYWKLEKVSAGLLGGTLDAENGDVNLININANNITANRGNFVSLALNELNSNLYVTGNELRYVHTNGSETRINAQGMYHREGGTNYETSYLNDTVTVTGLNTSSKTNPRWINLPSIYRGKQFTVVAVFSDAYGHTESAWYNDLGINRIVCFVDVPNIDYANARVPVVGYVRTRNLVNESRQNWNIQIQLLVSY